MRLDNKYFGLFISVCALLTIVVIIYGSVSYSQKQESLFRENVESYPLHEVELERLSDGGSLAIGTLQGRPVLLHFWASWSGRSRQVQQWIDERQQDRTDLVVVAIAVRDDPDLLKLEIDELPYDFIWVLGTELYHELQVPGVPSQILLHRDGSVAGVQVGYKLGRMEELWEAIR